MNASSAILDYLRKQPDDFTFSSAGIAMKLGLSLGAVNGFIHRMLAQEALKLDHIEPGTQGRTRRVYRLVNLDTVVVRKNGGIGGKAGRSMNGKPKKEKLVELLMHVAQELEALEVKKDIADFTTAELLKEIAKRTNV